jgi:NADH dehydrogenase
VLGLGSETNYFGVPGLEKYSHGMKTIDDALRLKKHIDEVLHECLSDNKEQQLCAGKFVVVGGGATGVELAAELVVYARMRAKELGADTSLVSVTLIEAASRLLPTMSEDVSRRVERQIRSLGVNVHLNRAVRSEELTGVALQDMEIKSSTVVWTAGVSAHRLHKDLSKAQFDARGRVYVGQYQYVLGYDNVFVLGDGAATQYSGMAQTALAHAKLVTRAIAHTVHNTEVRRVSDPKPIWAIPVGGRWSVTVCGLLTFYGYTGWILRRVVDWAVFTSFLPKRKAWKLFTSSHNLPRSG